MWSPTPPRVKSRPESVSWVGTSSMDLLAQRLPPQSPEAEVSVLGGVLLDNEALNRVLEVMTEGDFYREAHRKIFSAIISLYEKSEPVDLITLSEALKKREALEQIGGIEYLNS